MESWILRCCTLPRCRAKVKMFILHVSLWASPGQLCTAIWNHSPQPDQTSVCASWCVMTASPQPGGNKKSCMDQLTTCDLLYFCGYGGGHEWIQRIFQDASNAKLIECIRTRVTYNQMVYVGVCGGAYIAGHNRPSCSPSLRCFDFFAGRNITYDDNAEDGHWNDLNTLCVTSGTGLYVLLDANTGLLRAEALVTVKSKGAQMKWNDFVVQQTHKLQALIVQISHTWQGPFLNSKGDVWYFRLDGHAEFALAWSPKVCDSSVMKKDALRYDVIYTSPFDAFLSIMRLWKHLGSSLLPVFRRVSFSSSRLMPPIPQCSHCGQRTDAMRVCSFCSAASYCSRHCQKLHWKKSHSRSCSTTITLCNCGGDAWQMSCLRTESVHSFIERIHQERQYSDKTTLNLVLGDEILPRDKPCWRTGLFTGCTVWVTEDQGASDSDTGSIPNLMPSSSDTETIPRQISSPSISDSEDALVANFFLFSAR